MTGCDVIFAGMKQMPAVGTEEFCKMLYVKAGGSANTAIALAKMGISTLLLT